ncbi:MAG: family 20 glycosylhydrolase [Candidatus Marinimicrobia bacterium]|nr:family 20 glycosylhydrolase [Candidatus Neomarinimicrobiota bacterium]
MKILKNFSIFFSFLFIVNCSTEKVGPNEGDYWQAVHLLNFNNNEDLAKVGDNLSGFKEKGINLIILEVDYHFEFQSHPELRQTNDVITKEAARKFARLCRKNDIRLIIQFQSVGHQSWADKTFKLLSEYPELDLTPGAYPNNDSIYCREWDVTNPRVYEIVFPLMDELIDAFQVDGMHVGMDEVFLLQSEYAINTKDQNPAEMYAKAVNDIYNHLVKEKGVEMFMWGDRFINAEAIDYGEWEASANGTWPAIDRVPKDIIICDWHYEPRDTYASIPMFIEKGFRVLPCSWHNAEASQKLIQYSLQFEKEKMLGHLYTNWGGKIEDLVNWPTMIMGEKYFQSSLDSK